MLRAASRATTGQQHPQCPGLGTFPQQGAGFSTVGDLLTLSLSPRDRENQEQDARRLGHQRSCKPERHRETEIELAPPDEQRHDMDQGLGAGPPRSHRPQPMRPGEVSGSAGAPPALSPTPELFPPQCAAQAKAAQCREPWGR